jgi:Protein of unknown function (DUF732)
MALMDKRVRRPSDPTVAASLDGGQTVAAPLDGGHTVAASVGGGETTALPNTRPTDKVERAWSTGDVLGGEEIPEKVSEEKPRATVDRQSWGATLRIAALLVAGCLVLAGAIVLGRWALTSEKTPTNAAPSQGASSAGPASSATPASIASTKDQDDKFLQSLTANGVNIRDIDPQAVITSGKVVCQHMLARWTVPQTVADFKKENEGNPDLANRANDFVNISINTYCPQYPR